MTTPEHDSAVQRLDVEHVEQERLRVRYRAAIGAPADHRRLGAAGDQVAPREAWLRWIHEDSYRGLNAGPFELLAVQPSLGVGSDHVVGREVQRMSERKPPKDDQARDAKDRDVRRTRRLSRAAEAFRKRAEATERRWLTGLRAADKDPNEDKPRR